MITNDSVSINTKWLTVLEHVEDIDWKLLTLVLFNNGRAKKDALRKYFKTEIAFASTLERLIYYEIVIDVDGFVCIPANVKPNFHDQKPKALHKQEKVVVEGAVAGSWQSFVPQMPMPADIRKLTWDIFTFGELDKTQPYLYIINIKDWVASCRQLKVIIGDDTKILQEACKRLKEGNFTIAGPRSLLKTCAAIRRGDFKPKKEVIEVY